MVDVDGGNLQRITTERFGADTPTVEPTTGRIVYSRWWRTAQARADLIGARDLEDILPGSPGYSTAALKVSEFAINGIDEEDFPGINSWFLAGIDPDGTDLEMYSGFRLDREMTQAYRPSFLESGDVLALFIPKTPLLGYPTGNGLRVFSQGIESAHRVGRPADVSNRRG